MLMRPHTKRVPDQADSGTARASRFFGLASPARLTILLTIAAGALIVASITITTTAISWGNEKVVSTVPPTATSTDAGTDIDEAETVWRRHIDKHGTSKSYEQFKAHYAEADPLTQHTAAHIFGGLIYEHEGLAGTDVCDSTYANGCYHEFFGRAIAEHGLGVFEELADYCKNINCLHGLGHGLLAASGYDRAGLEASLAHCDRLPDEPLPRGCAGGVFMEYNLRTFAQFSRSADKDERTHRKFSLDNPHDPCDTLDPKFRASCYHWQIQWWHLEIPESVDTYRRIIEWCDSIPDHATRMDCFRSAGAQLLVSTEWNLEAIEDICDMVPSREGTLRCLSGARLFYAGDTGNEEEADTLCRRYVGAEYEQCRTTPF